MSAHWLYVVLVVSQSGFVGLANARVGLCTPIGAMFVVERRILKDRGGAVVSRKRVGSARGRWLLKSTRHSSTRYMRLGDSRGRIHFHIADYLVPRLVEVFRLLSCSLRDLKIG